MSSTDKKEYSDLLSEKDRINSDINELMQSEELKKFFKLKEDFKEITSRLKDLHKKIKIDEYNTCNHIMIYTNDQDADKRTCGCIKCGLDNSVLDKPLGSLSDEDMIMYQYLHNNKPETSTLNTHRICDLKTGCSIYKAIVKSNPNIDDKDAVNLFEVALDNLEGEKEKYNDDITKRISLTYDDGK